jgi:H+/Cl- antiporter ClcA
MRIIRAVSGVLLTNIVALLLIAVAGFLTVRFTTSGHWAVDSTRASSAELASQYGDPVALLERGVLFHLWVTGPVIALIVGALAALVFRRADWRVSTLGIVSLVVVLSTPTSVVKILATCLYIVASWLAMKLVSSWLGSSVPGAAAALPQK